MRKSAAGAALIGALGCSALTVAPATAATLPFPNCDAAAAVGVYKIPADSPAYTAALDSDSDGIGCESDTYAYNPARIAEIVATDQQLATMPPGTGIVAGPEGTGLEQAPQIEQMPVGGADTGVSAATAKDHNAAAIAATLALAATAGAALLIRRHTRIS